MEHRVENSFYWPHALCLCSLPFDHGVTPFIPSYTISASASRSQCFSWPIRDRTAGSGGTPCGSRPLGPQFTSPSCRRARPPGPAPRADGVFRLVPCSMSAAAGGPRAGCPLWRGCRWKDRGHLFRHRLPWATASITEAGPLTASPAAKTAGRVVDREGPTFRVELRLVSRPASSTQSLSGSWPMAGITTSTDRVCHRPFHGDRAPPAAGIEFRQLLLLNLERRDAVGAQHAPPERSGKWKVMPSSWRPRFPRVGRHF